MGTDLRVSRGVGRATRVVHVDTHLVLAGDGGNVSCRVAGVVGGGNGRQGTSGSGGSGNNIITTVASGSSSRSFQCGGCGIVLQEPTRPLDAGTQGWLESSVHYNTSQQVISSLII